MIRSTINQLLSYGIALCCTMMLGHHANGHPSIGIVTDSKGNIYYTDLEQVWKISNGQKSLVVPDVHTHELFIDGDDNLIGEHLWYAGDASKKFYHYLWRLGKTGEKQIIVPETQAFIRVDYSMARDKEGNQYYCKFTDSMHLYVRNALNQEKVLVSHDFRGVKFFLPQSNGDILFTNQNSAFRILSNGEILVLARNMGSSDAAMPWGIWQDAASNVYVAVFNDKVIKKITTHGEVSEFYRSEKGWAPANGVFDTNKRLWLLEWSDKNEVRAIMMGEASGVKKKKSMALPLSVGFAIVLAFWVGFTQRRKVV